MAQTITQPIEVWDSAKTSSLIAINGTATVYSSAFKIDKGEYFGIAYKASSGGTIKVRLELEVSLDGINFATAENMPMVDPSIEDSDYHTKTLPVVRCTYMRFKITGLAGNAATTKLQITISL